ncbi:ABC transporter permease [Salinibacter sp.]|jgi:ABC-type transport system involved in multi-copper enzyme maturation permease subunit|uniref:ABC transporter permease n=1 Tax=Salinibacter sp. TaxID=2065818 RepID=UPI0021E74BDD|nr:ABC transporter permease [Salinibacter sp.]
MRPLLGLVLITFRELWARKIVLGLFIVSSLVLLAVTFALNLDVVEGSLAGIRLFGQEAAPEDMGGEDAPPLTLSRVVVAVESVVAGVAYWIGILLALFASASLFPDLQSDGRVELLLSKPIGRLNVLFGHMLGVWSAIGILAVYLLGGVWVIMSLKTGVWNPRFLLSLLLVVGMFAVMYAAVMLMGVWTESTALGLIVSYGLIFISMVLAAADQIGPTLGPVGGPVFWGLYHGLPNFTEVTQIVSTLAKGEAVSSWYPFVSSLLFGGAAYAVTGYWFVRRDF